jgi:hypothetical protein
MRILMSTILTAVACLSLNLQPVFAEDDFVSVGVVQFGNLQATLSTPGETSPYVGIGESPQLGTVVQTGSILPITAPVPVGYDAVTNVVTLQFNCIQGTHPARGQGDVHIIHAKGGKIFCTWTALFTMELDLDNGEIVLSGDGEFTVTGGTGQFRNVTGRFQTLFETDVIPFGADTTQAEVTQKGEVCR